MSQPYIGVLGCGWLGLPLAVYLQNKGYAIRGSVTSEEGLPKLKEKNIDGFVVRLHENGVSGDALGFLKNTSLLIIAIPPGFRKNADDSYFNKMKSLWHELNASDVKQVLFMSSTSVFGDHQSHITDVTQPEPDTLSGEKLVEVERFVLSQTQKTTLFRLGGLFGPNRHPISFLAGRTQVPQPNGKIHFIHLNDIQEIVEKWLKIQPNQSVFNLCHPQLPSRIDYYTTTALQRQLTPPTFDENDRTQGKSIYPDGVLTILQHRFKHQELAAYPVE
jgi:nucleoside-diphosphate-sugar epimerase